MVCRAPTRIKTLLHIVTCGLAPHRSSSRRLPQLPIGVIGNHVAQFRASQLLVANVIADAIFFTRDAFDLACNLRVVGYLW